MFVCIYVYVYICWYLCIYVCRTYFKNISMGWQDVRGRLIRLHGRQRQVLFSDILTHANHRLYKENSTYLQLDYLPTLKNKNA